VQLGKLVVRQSALEAQAEDFQRLGEAFAVNLDQPLSLDVRLIVALSAEELGLDS